MASWKKYFKVSGQTDGSLSPVSGITSDQSKADFAFRNYQSSLPEVYSGHPNRVERYNQYEAMDMDSEVNACLDIISEFSTSLILDEDLNFHYYTFLQELNPDQK